MHVAMISPTSQAVQGTPLKIQNGAVRFFVDALDESLEFFDVTPGDHDKKRSAQWHLTFFPSSAYRRDYRVNFSWDLDEADKPHAPAKGSVVVNTPRHSGLEQDRDRLKDLLAAPKSVRDDQWSALSDDNQLLGVRFNMGVLGGDYQFERQVLLQVLGLAYADVMDEMMKSCRQAVLSNDHDALFGLHEEALLFLAAHVYAHPVKRNAEVIYQSWEHVRDQLNLAALEQDCIEQWQRVGRLSGLRAQSARQDAIRIEEQQREAANKQQSRLSNRIALVGVVFAFVTLALNWESDLADVIRSLTGGSEVAVSPSEVFKTGLDD